MGGQTGGHLVEEHGHHGQHLATRIHHALCGCGSQYGGSGMVVVSTVIEVSMMNSKRTEGGE